LSRFDTEAKNWDANSTREGLNTIFSTELKSFLDKNPSNCAIDFGCGTGNLTFEVADRFEEIYCIDSSKAMIEELEKKLDEKHAHVKTHRSDSLKEIEPKRADIIYSAMVFHHIEDIKSLLEEIKLHLKSGGKVVVFDLCAEDGSFHPSHMDDIAHFGFEKEELKSFFHETGFSEFEFRVIDEVKKNQKTYPLFMAVATL
jgi:ubiquinone/menaquinone biosynthesis C-methylase UbiE